MPRNTKVSKNIQLRSENLHKSSTRLKLKQATSKQSASDENMSPNIIHSSVSSDQSKDQRSKNQPQILDTKTPKIPFQAVNFLTDPVNKLEDQIYLFLSTIPQVKPSRLADLDLESIPDMPPLKLKLVNLNPMVVTQDSELYWTLYDMEYDMQKNEILKNANIGDEILFTDYDFYFNSWNWDKEEGQDISHINSKERGLRIEIDPFEFQ